MDTLRDTEKIEFINIKEDSIDLSDKIEVVDNTNEPDIELNIPNENMIEKSVKFVKTEFNSLKTELLEFIDIVYFSPDLPFREDIQILRALAVIIVFLYHLDIHTWVFGGGFIGVDIFFVISGYLVVGSLIKEELKNSFSLSVFLSRRIKRLFIPSVCCLIFIAIGAFFLHFNAFDDISAAALHWINYYYYIGENEYFNLDSSERLVLHYWSLAVEEQFYFLLPILFYLYKIIIWILGLEIGSKSIILYLSVVTTSSLILIFILQQSMKFFFVFPRIWEFLFGALVFLTEGKIESTISSWIPTNIYTKSCIIFQILCIGILIILSFLISSKSFPNIFSVLVVSITSLYIMCKPSLKFRPLEQIGYWSYSIYLYHYPIIKFVKVIKIHKGLQILIITISTLFFSLISYYLIEKVHRNNKWSPKQWILFYIFVSCLIGLTCSNISLKINRPMDSVTNYNISLDLNDVEWNETVFYNNFDECIRSGWVGWGPGFTIGKWDAPGFECQVPLETFNGRKDKCIILLGTSETRQWVKPIRQFAKLINASIYDGCSHNTHLYNISSDCKEVITFIKPRFIDPHYGIGQLNCSFPNLYIEFNKDLRYYSKFGCVFPLVSPDMYRDERYMDRNGVNSIPGSYDILKCIKENPDNIQQCNVHRNKSVFKLEYCFDNYLLPNVSILDFTDLICDSEICHVDKNNYFVTGDAMHYCQNFMDKYLGPVLLNKLLLNECAKKILRS